MKPLQTKRLHSSTPRPLKPTSVLRLVGSECDSARADHSDFAARIGPERRRYYRRRIFRVVLSREPEDSYARKSPTYVLLIRPTKGTAPLIQQYLAGFCLR